MGCQYGPPALGRAVLAAVWAGVLALVLAGAAAPTATAAAFRPVATWWRGAMPVQGAPFTTGMCNDPYNGLRILFIKTKKVGGSTAAGIVSRCGRRLRGNARAGNVVVGPPHCVDGCGGKGAARPQGDRGGRMRRAACMSLVAVAVAAGRGRGLKILSRGVSIPARPPSLTNQ